MCEICWGRNSLVGHSLGKSLAGSDSGSTKLTRPDQPLRPEFIIRGAHIISMDESIGDISAGSIHIRNGEIVAVGKDLATEYLHVIDAAGMIMLPGLIDTHWHMWHTIFRSFSGETKETGFYPTITRFASAMHPQDMYASTGLAAAEAVNAGITTVHSWCHNNRGPEYAASDVKALADSGVRARWSFGQKIDQSDKELIDLPALVKMHADWKKFSNGGLIDLGLAWRGMFRSEWLPENIYREEFDAARHLKIPISTHIATLASRKGHVAAHAKAGLLGPDVNVVHACGADAEEIAMIRDSGASVSLTILSELRGGWGVPKLYDCLAAGVRVAAGVDTAPLVGEANMFKIMSFAIAMENGIAQDEFRMLPRKALALATIDAARVLDIADRTGSLTPGKRADLIMISTNALNMGVFTDPVHMVVDCARPENVETVIIDGVVHKAGGRLTKIEPAQIIENAQRSLREVRQRAAWR